jgi:hypothetical protein
MKACHRGFRIGLASILLSSQFAVSRLTWSQKYNTSRGLPGGGNAEVEKGYVLAVDGLEFDRIERVGEVLKITGRQPADAVETVWRWQEFVGLDNDDSEEAGVGDCIDSLDSDSR